MNLTAEQWAYLGGLFEGDGYLGVTEVRGNKNPMIAITQSNLNFINHLNTWFPKWKIYKVKNKRFPDNDCWQLKTYRNDECIHFLKGILPYLINRKNDANEMIVLCEQRLNENSLLKKRHKDINYPTPNENCNAARFAGFTDAEGCISFAINHPDWAPQFCVAQKEKSTLEHLCTLLPQFEDRWVIYGEKFFSLKVKRMNDLFLLLKLITPFLILKQQKASMGISTLRRCIARKRF